jgi:serine/threonine protein phosphatase 1
MGVLVLGDVHGCYYTLKKMVKTHFNPQEDLLVQVGDLINKGPHSGKCVKYWQKLEAKHPQRVFIIRGNHEQAFIEAFRQEKVKGSHPKLLANLEQAGLNPLKVYQWFLAKPLSWEGQGLLVTHAGLSIAANDPFNIQLEHNVLENRKPLKRLNLTQVIGHTVVKNARPVYSAKENAWYIDTGAFAGDNLTGVLFWNNGESQQVYQLSTDERDLL